MTQQTTRKLRKIESDFIVLEIGDVIEGILTKKDTITFPGKNGNPPSTVGKYSILNEGTQKTSGFLGATKIDQLLDDVQEGTFVKITRNKDGKTSSGNKLKDYTLEVEA